MIRRFASTLAVMAAFVGFVLAADKEIKGKIVKYDPETREIVVKTTTGDEEHKLAADAKIFDLKGAETKDGTKDKRLAKGADIRLLIPEKARTVKEVYFVDTTKPDTTKTATKTDTSKTVAKTDATKTATKTDAGKTDAGKTVAKVDSNAKMDADKAKAKATEVVKGKVEQKAKTRSEPPENAAAARFGAESKGEVAKILKIDTEKRLVTFEMSNGKKVEYKVAEDCKFVGPRGGKADIEDDRLDEGHYVKLGFDSTGKIVKEVHLAYRRAEREENNSKDGKEAKK